MTNRIKETELQPSERNVHIGLSLVKYLLEEKKKKKKTCSTAMLLDGQGFADAFLEEFVNADPTVMSGHETSCFGRFLI